MEKEKKIVRKSVRLSDKSYNFINSFGNESDGFGESLDKMIIEMQAVFNELYRLANTTTKGVTNGDNR